MDFLIHKLTWEIISESEEEAKGAQQEVSNLLNSSEFLERLESQLTGLFASDRRLVIDHLTIDLSDLPVKGWHKELPNKLARELSENLRVKLANKSEIEMQEVSHEKDFVQQFISFMKTGIIPPQMPSSITTTRELSTWLSEQLSVKDKSRDALLSTLLNDAAARNAFSKWPLSELWRELVAKSTRASGILKQIISIDETLEKAGEDVEPERHQFRILAWRYLLDETTEPKLTLTAIHRVLSQALPMVSRGQVAKLQAAYEYLEKQAGMLQQSAFTNSTISRLIAESKEEGKIEPAKVADTLFVKNAGLVLVAPFLPQLFASLGVVDNKEVADPELALQLLTYINSGDPKEKRSDLALMKILCGIPKGELVVPFNRISPKQRREVDAMLIELIGHWKALKNTSPDGLREGYFWREGKLTSAKDFNTLKVEGKAQDVLLAQLPWAIGIIKLPWMQKPLHVDWS